MRRVEKNRTRAKVLQKVTAIPRRSSANAPRRSAATLESKKPRSAPTRIERSGSEALQEARRALTIEAEAILAISDRLDAQFDCAIDLLAACRGKIVVMGIGKSGIICRKIAATFASTGTPATFLHAAEAVHGDFGLVDKGDVVLAISHSGETDEVLRVLPLIERFDLSLIAVTGNPASTLGRAADAVLDASVPEEACPLGLAPTSSTTAALALGDALAVALLKRKGFTENDFAVLHPAGSLGRRLLKVADLMHSGESMPLIAPDTSLADTVSEITSKRLGVTGVIDADGQLIGVVTDGDLRRGLGHKEGIQHLRAADLMTPNPKSIEATALAGRAVAEMERYSITSLFVLTPDSHRPIGVIHLHDLLKAGVA